MCAANASMMAFINSVARSGKVVNCGEQSERHHSVAPPSSPGHGDVIAVAYACGYSMQGTWRRRFMAGPIH